MNFTSRMRLRGDLTIELFEAKGFDEAVFLARARDNKITDRDIGKRTFRSTVRNTITFTGITAPLILLAQNAGTVATDYQMATFTVGTNSTPPSRGDTALGSPVSGGSGGSITLVDANRAESPSTGELIITVSYGTGAANGFTLTEAGIFLGNGGLFSRQVNPGLPKTSAFIAGYTWRFGLTG